MRISCDRTDQGFSPTFEQFVPTLNGHPMLDAITADEEMGMVRVVDRDGAGNTIERVLFGCVKIERVH
jgi:hypothetical protein